MIEYRVHDDLNHKVKVYYDDIAEAERNTHQWCHVTQFYTRPTVLQAYRASNEKLCDLYRKLAS